MKSVQLAAKMVRPKQSTLALLAVGCAVAGLISVFFVGAGAVLPEVAAVVLGHFALREIRASAGTFSGGGLAVTALVIGYGSLAIAALAVMALILGLFFL